jgi:bifunctional oligoribonuclease and PAP phosphatase NrnA
MTEPAILGAATAPPARPALAALTPADVAAVPADVIARIRSARRVMTVCHYDPEADALGSALGVALAVEELGGRATPVCADPVPRMYDFLPGMERFRQGPEPGVEYDLIVVGDCGDLARVGGVAIEHAALFARVPIVNIDHHKSNTGFGVVDWVDPAASATCEMVTLLVAALGLPLTAGSGTMAANLMAGVVIDTANFQHPNVTARTLRVAAELRAAGAPLPDIARQLYRTKPNPQLRLFGSVLARLETDPGGRLVWSVVNDADFAAAGALPSHSEGLIDMLSQSETGQVAILFKDLGATTRISVRTKDGGVDATVLTGRFGGGGHARAAGATIGMALDDARVVVLAEAKRLVDALPDGGG